MFIHDCRTDSFYNVEHLNDSDKAEVRGYDWCTDAAVDTFFDNLDVYFDDDSVVMELMNKELPESMKTEYDTADGEDHREVKTYGDYFRMNLLIAIESTRDEMIVSMVDNASGGTMGD